MQYPLINFLLSAQVVQSESQLQRRINGKNNPNAGLLLMYFTTSVAASKFDFVGQLMN